MSSNFKSPPSLFTHIVPQLLFPDFKISFKNDEIGTELVVNNKINVKVTFTRLNNAFKRICQPSTNSQ